jgi:hypothetical protein
MRQQKQTPWPFFRERTIVHAPTENKIDDVKKNFCEELEPVLYYFRKYHMTILLRDCSAKIGREDIFIPAIENETLHKINMIMELEW